MESLSAAENNDEFRTRTFYISPERFDRQRVVFPAGEEHHIRNVLRLGEGSVVEVLDGCGGKFKVVLEKADRTESLEGRILSAEKECQPPVRISVALAFGRRERMRTAVEKLSELGCHRIVPLLTDFVFFNGRRRKQVEKLRLVSIGALKQSRNRFLTRIDEPLTLERFLSSTANGQQQLVFCKKKMKKGKILPAGTPDKDKEYFLLVGPEGGFSPREIESIQDLSPLCVHLGDADLRFETAAVAGFVLLREHLAGDLLLYRAGQD